MSPANDIPPPLVSIVGAGPGAADLLTLRALRRLEQAEVVLYDNLVSAEIMALCAPGAVLAYAGKKYGDQLDPEQRQQAINEALVAHARQGKRVVRLKSGDPVIFGRAAEEIRYLREQQVPYEVVPGLTAGIAAASLAHIPLTERNHSNAVLLCTAHTANYDFEQLDALANMLHTGTTLVLYMGLSNLGRVVETLRAAAGSETIYVSAISQVSGPGQRLVTALLPEIETALAQANLPLPVVFIIGKYACSLDEAAAYLIP
ncbi:MAG: uroporphyrinogen-III C-methyltransferase [Hymenobacter sp.]